MESQAACRKCICKHTYNFPYSDAECNYIYAIRILENYPNGCRVVVPGCRFNPLGGETTVLLKPLAWYLPIPHDQIIG